MTLGLSLPAMLSKALVAFTIEFDNEFEHRMPHTTTRGPAARSGAGPWLVSMPMWSNLLRWLDPVGVPLRDLDDLTALVNLNGLVRWGYLRLDDGLLTLTRAGRTADQVWAPLAEEIEDGWAARYGRSVVASVRQAAMGLSAGLAPGLPWYLPVSGFRRPEPESGRIRTDRVDVDPPTLACLLSRPLQAFAAEVSERSPLSLVVGCNVLRVLLPEPVAVRDLPARAGVSREATRHSLQLLERVALVEPVPGTVKAVRLTLRGQVARQRQRRVIAEVESDWDQRFGAAGLQLSQALDALLSHGDALAAGLEPYPDGWRAHPPYRTLTRALLAEPVSGLPEFPVVSHRGGFPDGS